MTILNETFEYIPFKKRILKTLGIVGIIYGVFIIISIISSLIILFYFFTLISIFLFVSMIQNDINVLYSLTSDKAGIKIEYYNYATLKSVYVDWQNFDYEICYPFSKNGDRYPYFKFKNKDELIDEFKGIPGKRLFEISYLLTKAKHDFYQIK